MRVTTYGTRGSIPVSSPHTVRYGGNTTCLRVESDCLPEGHWLSLDAGTGLRPMGDDFRVQNGKELTILQSHWHHDHTQGFPLAFFVHAKVPIHIYGPRDKDMGPGEVYEQLMKPPFFPVDWREAASHVYSHGLECPNATMLLFHPTGGRKQMEVRSFDAIAAKEGQVTFKGGTFNIDECLVVKMRKVNHPDYTVSYRFEERPTGQIFVFLTDHENQDGNHRKFVDQLRNADLLIMDTQYSRDMYEKSQGYGHASADYAAKLAAEAGVKALGTTHHDPGSTDDHCDQIVANVQSELVRLEKDIVVFGARDYLVVDVGAITDSLNIGLSSRF